MFWTYRLNLIAILLLPFALVYAIFGKIIRAFSRPFYIKQLKTPVISFMQITNFNVGKTPLLREVAKYLGAPVLITDKDHWNIRMLEDAGITVLSGGLTGAMATAEFLGRKYPAVIVDGKQYNADIKILVFDDYFGIGNGLPFPAGPMRKSIREAVAKSDAVMIIQGDDKTVPAGILKIARRYGRPLFLARREIDVAGIFGKFVAFTSIPYPARFFESLRMVPAIRMVDRIKFQPGQHLDKKTMVGLFYTARRYDARLITTEKDWYGLPRNIRAKIKRAPVRIGLPPNFYIWLEKKLGEKNG